MDFPLNRLSAAVVYALVAIVLDQPIPALAGDGPSPQQSPNAMPIQLEPIGSNAVSIDDLAIPSPLGDMALGSKDAPVTIIEYASMTCSHCADFSQTSFPKLRSDYVDTGKVRYVFREFPLDIKAVAGSILARCIAKGDSARFFALTEELFRTQNEWIQGNTGDRLKALARKEGLEEREFEACFADQNAIAGIQRTQDIAAGKLKVTSTPSFFINGQLVKGNAYPEIVKAIETVKK